MKRTFKTVVSLSLCTFLTLSAVSCKSNTAQNTTDSAAANEPVTIKWLAYQTLAQPDPESEICKTVEAKFNVKFDFMYVDDSNWDDQLNVKLSAGELPDVMKLRDQNHIAKYVQQGILAELPQETIKEKAPNYVKMVEKYDKNNVIWKETIYNGKNYGFGNINVDGTYPGPIIWRTDWLQNVGITKTPSTIAEFETAMQKFRNDDPDKDGTKDTYGMSNTMLPIIYAAYGITNAGNAELTTKDGKIVFSSTTPEAKQALLKLAEWYGEGLIDPEYVTGEHTTGYWAISNAFVNNKIGVTGLGSFYHYNAPLYDGDIGSAVYQEFQKSNATAQYAPGKPIVGPTGKSGAVMGNYASEPIGITVQGAKNQRIVDTTLAMLDATYADDKDYYTLNTFGTKDVDYTVNAQGIYTSKISVASDARKKGILVFTLASQNPDLKKQAYAPLYKWGDENFNYEAISVPFVNPTKDYLDAVTQYQQNLQKLTTQAYTDMITGKEDINSYFDSYVKQFNENGGTAIEKCANEALNAK